MRLTRFSDIGLRVLIYLARTGPKGAAPVTVAEIAEQFDLPVNHLVKVVGQLARAKWVLAVRGRNGGLHLAVDPATLKVGQVLRLLEGDGELIDCEGIKCQLSGDCGLREALKMGMRAYYQVMDGYSLADITRGNTGEQIVHMHQAFLMRREQVNT
jgi:Rrf2 family nitric oxide-sensitive transcriptional repressor